MTVRYFVIHSSLLYIDSLSRNHSLCTVIKSEGPISFKSGQSVADCHQLKAMPRLCFNKNVSIMPQFGLPLFFSYGTSLVQIISKNNQTSLSQS